MDKELLKDAEKLWDRQTRGQKFQTRFGVYPIEEGKQLVNNFYKLSRSVPPIPEPANLDEVYTAELRRRTLAEAVLLEHTLSGRPYAFDDVVNIYGIEPDDIEGLRPWLEENRQPTLEAVERVFKETDVKEYELTLPLDRPSVKRQAEEYAQQRVSFYHRRLGRMFESITGVGGFLRDITPVVTTDQRSYFDTLTKTLAIGIPAICFLTEDGLPHLRERELVKLFGHEGFGHGCNKVLTDAAVDIPFFLRLTSGATIATLESVAQFYERQIFEDLKQSPETQKALEIAHNFDDIYQEERDTQQIERYKLRIFQYGITVLADKAYGDPKDPQVIAKKIERLEPVSLYPGSARYFIEHNKQNFDSQGNLDPSLVAELRYAAQPVQRVLSILQTKGFNYRGNDRTQTDTILLQGFWTPIGLVERSQVL